MERVLGSNFSFATLVILLLRLVTGCPQEREKGRQEQPLPFPPKSLWCPQQAPRSVLEDSLRDPQEPRQRSPGPPPVRRRALRDSLSVRAPCRWPDAVQLRAAYKGSVARSPRARTRA